ncbi:MAG: hypothetical protein A2860_01220 [Candidatus Levybacteria bacterium RIFCSPHIGHO2_01_FULL_37_33]|uniref:Uncharacterized protein n=1 Tax=Candidatus Zambryskibacteria bacterium RIFCSPHIGHO2_12_FULL_38_37 TaxID=1802751 RepID=A0A1G2TKE0_9BACT|nr:MAG: hypothetical protein A2860_01220 [Candidatus Levybacteria bacterium RIFCSPHIGHO2_01_FULL_37_33]OHA97745.1 MAG: hypothetical protein A3E32_01040 [Candidatus Zambryskibacteria bacterium RIFCSPHIGHO2_12_FULL_38_37]OHB14217.1 MAG: hypothetical protein A3G47_02455 [Candidatus Zambryskibacteria bacterium RIFCSPLOWO2_12_FULL_39_45]
MVKKKENKRETDTWKLDRGEDLYVIAGEPLPNGEIKAKYFFSNEIPLAVVGGEGMKRSIKVSYSSIANDNEQLLHFLYGKTRTQ